MSWAERAACRGYPTAWWFVERGDMFAVDVARSICARCPVRRDCLDEALDLEAEPRFGIVGGLTPHQRTRLARQGGR
jgi:WhiB family redox-sensing transcriptional regulator